MKKIELNPISLSSDQKIAIMQLAVDSGYVHLSDTISDIIDRYEKMVKAIEEPEEKDTASDIRPFPV